MSFSIPETRFLCLRMAIGRTNSAFCVPKNPFFPRSFSISCPCIFSSVTPEAEATEKHSRKISNASLRVPRRRAISPNVSPVSTESPEKAAFIASLLQRTPERFSVTETEMPHRLKISRTASALSALEAQPPICIVIADLCEVSSAVPPPTNVAPQAQTAPYTFSSPSTRARLSSGSPFCEVQTTPFSAKRPLRNSAISPFSFCFVIRKTTS